MSKKDQIIEEIRKIYDPELPVNIYDVLWQNLSQGENQKEGKHYLFTKKGVHKNKACATRLLWIYTRKVGNNAAETESTFSGLKRVVLLSM